MEPFEFYVNSWYLNRVSLAKVLYLQVHLTQKCQNHCKHCYHREIDSDIDTFSLDALLQILQVFNAKAKLLGYPFQVDFTGGDPFLYPYLSEVVRFCKEMNINYGFKGNPEIILANPKIIDCYLKPSTGISLSVDGLYEFHDSLRCRGSFSRTVRAMELIKNSGVFLRINTTVSKGNANCIIPLLDYFLQNGFIIDDYTWARYWSLEETSNILSASELRILFDNLTDYLKRKFNDPDFYYKTPDNRVVPRIMFSFKEHMWYPYFAESGVLSKKVIEKVNRTKNSTNCTATKHVYIIDPDCKIYKCRKLPETSINIDDIGLDIACNYTKGVQLGCAKCYYYNGCGGCSAISKSFTGSISEIEPNCPYKKRTSNPSNAD